MISRIVALMLIAVPMMADAAPRGDSVRVGVARPTSAGARVPTVSKTLTGKPKATGSVGDGETGGAADDDAPNTPSGGTESGGDTGASGNCRDAFRACMDEFCLFDESEGYRCSCSDSISQTETIIKEIQDLQQKADELFTEGVQHEITMAEIGASRVDWVYGQEELGADKNKVDYLGWLGDSAANADSDEEVEMLFGDDLYEKALDYCAVELESCGGRAEMEKALYERQITADCKAYNAYLADQKTNAEANKRTAEMAVRQTRLDRLEDTNKYNRGECLLAYRACIADKGGCGVNFENCLDPSLLDRRAHACDNILDSCVAVRSEVLTDWRAEAAYIITEAQQYAETHKAHTCLSRIQACLEDSCSTSTNSACLTSIDIAAGFCPVIDECNDLTNGALKSAITDQLGYLRVRFCQNDVDACLREKCGDNFSAPECVGRSVDHIAQMCPQDMFPTCKGADMQDNYDAIVSSVMLQMDYKMVQGCVNYFGEQLGRVCGTDMSCLPSSDIVAALTEIPSETDVFTIAKLDNKGKEVDDEERKGIAGLRESVRQESKKAVENFFAQFEGDRTVAACQSTNVDELKGVGSGLGDSVFTTAKMIAEINAENRAMRELETKIAELSRQQDLVAAEKNCYDTYKVEEPTKGQKNYSYIRSVAFEPDLRNCRVCRMQQICEEGGESKVSSALKAAAGGLTTGASTGTMVNAGWGTAIGAVVGAVGAGVGGYFSGGKQEFCQEIESCEDVNM